MITKNHDASQPETTLEGLLEAILGGDISAQELVDTVTQDPGLLEATPADMAMRRFKKMSRKGPLPGEQPGRPGKQGKGGMGCPLGRRTPPQESAEQTTVVPDTALTVQTFEALVDEGCGLRAKKKSKDKKSKSKIKDAVESQQGGPRPILEFAAPERQDVIRWARGAEPKRIGEGKTPFWFQDDVMISAGTPIARRNLGEKTAQVVHPKGLNAYSGRHAVLANHGLRYAGYDVEVVETL